MRQKRGQTDLAVWVFGSMAFLLAVYVLSIGPAYRLAVQGSLADDFYLGFYDPLIWIAEHSEAVGGLLDWSIGHWTPSVSV